jgi:hypothetical protein
MLVYRGVVKSAGGDLHYFNWNPETEFKLVKADNDTKRWDAQRMYSACSFGCDMRKADAPLDPGEPVDQDCGDEEEDADKAARHGKPAATVPIPEERNVTAQQAEITEVHPGAAMGQTPDDPLRGRQWHAKALGRPTDGMDPTANNDGQQHWNAGNLLKAWGQKLQATAPRLQPATPALESQYMQEVMGVTPEQISKGFRIPPRFRTSFEQWKSHRLRGRLDGLKGWLKSHDE